MDEVVISKAIVESYLKDLLGVMEMDVAIVGAGPSGMVTGYYLAKSKVKVAIFGGMLLSGRKAAELAIDLLKKIK